MFHGGFGLEVFGLFGLIIAEVAHVERYELDLNIADIPSFVNSCAWTHGSDHFVPNSYLVPTYRHPLSLSVHVNY